MMIMEITMSKIKKEQIEVQGFQIEVYTEDFKNDYISLTDIARYKNSDDPGFVIQNWLRNRNTIEFIGLWEQYKTPILTVCNSTRLEVRQD